MIEQIRPLLNFKRKSFPCRFRLFYYAACANLPAIYSLSFSKTYLAQLWDTPLCERWKHVTLRPRSKS